MKHWTVEQIRSTKGKEKLPCVTVTDCVTARLADQAGFPLLLVGDSLGMTTLGFSTTLPVTLEMMLHHTAAAARGIQNALLIADMPFNSYQASPDDALDNAARFLQEANADGVKIEGGAFRAPLVQRMTQNGIPVLGHIGLTPQSINQLGGYKVQGKTAAAYAQLIDDARALEQAGAFAVVVECVPPDLAQEMTQTLAIPVIGIGAGPACDGQILVFHDLIGFSGTPPAKFVKTYANTTEVVQNALHAYFDDVKKGAYPAPEHTYKPANVNLKS